MLRTSVWNLVVLVYRYAESHAAQRLHRRKSHLRLSHICLWSDFEFVSTHLVRRLEQNWFLPPFPNTGPSQCNCSGILE